MNCRDLRDRLVAYADDELGVESALELETHLERCPSCRASVEEQRALRRAVTSLYPRRQLPEEVRRTLLRGVQPAPSRRLGRMATALLAASLALVALVWMGRAPGSAAVPPEVGAALAAHAGAERGTPALDVASSSASQVSRWLADELPGVPPIGAEVPPGFRLEGASTVALPAARAGWVLYRRGAEPVSLFVLPPRTWPAFGRGIRQHGVEFRALEVGRHRVIAWSHPPVSYLLVSARDRSPSEACAVCHAGPDAPALEGFSLARDS